MIELTAVTSSREVATCDREQSLANLVTSFLRHLVT